MIQRLKDCWLILTGKGTIRVYDDDPWVPVEVYSKTPFTADRESLEMLKLVSGRFKPSLSDQSIEEIAASLVD